MEIETLFNNKKRDQLLADAKRAAYEAAKRDRSDPFIYNRVFSQVINGVGIEHGKSE